MHVDSSGRSEHRPSFSSAGEFLLPIACAVCSGFADISWEGHDMGTRKDVGGRDRVLVWFKLSMSPRAIAARGEAKPGRTHSAMVNEKELRNEG
eukprot:73036-Rhodomonas_salina.3